MTYRMRCQLCSWVIFIGVLLNGINLFAQVRQPVQANLTVLPPYSTKYNTYVSPVSNKMRAVINLTDLQEPSLDVRLSLIIEGGGIRLQTRENYIPPAPITLFPGSPAIIESSQWTEYFNDANLEFFGTSREQFVREGRFPEGMYTFSIVVREYQSGKIVSNPANAIVWLKLNDQPTIISPRIGEAIAVNGPQNIFFQWQLNSPNASGIPFTPMYRFFLYELISEEVDPIYALENGQTILVYESPDLMTTSLTYTLANPTLDLGKKYMFRVQAFDPSGQNEFRDNGFSPNAWFYYGYPNEGAIPLNAPENEYKFTSDDLQRFIFAAPDKLVENQRYRYEFKIVELEDINDDATAALEIGPFWYSENTPPTFQADQYVIDVRQKEFTKQQAYAWQVTAFTGEQEIAKSEIRKFSGPPAVDYFLAGKHRVIATDITNRDLSNLAGSGRVKIFQNEEDTIYAEVEFEGLRVEDAAGRYVLQEGEINYELENPLTFDLDPRNELNAPSTFNGLAIKLDKRNLEVKGYVGYPMPLPVLGGSEQPFIKTKEDWLNFNDYVPKGNIELGEVNSFDLLDPFGFKISFDETSAIQVYIDEYELALNGFVTVVESVVNPDGETISYPFQNADQIDYLNIDRLDNNIIKPIEEMAITLSNYGYIIDLSENRSPDQIEYDDWKGILLKDVELSLATDFDPSGQLTLKKGYNIDFQGQQNTALIDGEGLDFSWVHDFQNEYVGKFNDFYLRFGKFNLDIVDSEVENSGIDGAIVVPFIDPNEDQSIRLPITDEGLGQGYLNPGLENTTFTFNPEGGENQVILTVRRAVFEGNDRLDLITDVRIPALNVNIPSVKDFHIYGDYFIGFGERNGSFRLPNRPAVKFRNLNMNLLEIGAAVNNGRYLFNYNTELKMGEGFGDPDGKTPELQFVSVSPNRDSNLAREVVGKDFPPSLPIPELPGILDQEYLYVDNMTVVYKSALFNYESTMSFQRDDPDWGTVFRGEIKGQLNQPGIVEMGGSVVYGNKEDTEYFYLDAFGVDKTGIGKPLIPGIVNIVGFEGWLFKNMSLTNGELVIDKQNEFGINLFAQFIDAKTSGAKYQMDGSMEYTSKTKTFGVSGDISFINQNVRSATDYNSIAGKAQEDLKKEAAKQVVQRAMEVIGDIDETLSADGTDVRIQANTTKSSLSISKGNYTASVDADISGVPMLGGGIKKGADDVKILSDGSNAVSLQYTNGSLETDLRYQPNTGGVFDMTGADYEFQASTNSMANSVNLSLQANDETSENLTVYPTANNGKYELELGNLELELNGFFTDDKADLSISSGADRWSVLYDNIAKSGKLTKRYSVSTGTLFVEADFSQNETQQNLKAQIGNNSISSRANSSGIAVETTVNGNLLTLAYDGREVWQLNYVASDLEWIGSWNDSQATLTIAQNGTTETITEFPYSTSAFTFTTSNEQLIVSTENETEASLFLAGGGVVSKSVLNVSADTRNKLSAEIENEANVTVLPDQILAGWEDFRIQSNTNNGLHFISGQDRFGYLSVNAYDIEEFSEGIYTSFNDRSLLANKNKAGFVDGLDVNRRSFVTNYNYEYTYDEYENARFQSALSFGNGYAFKLDADFPNELFGLGAGLTTEGRQMANISVPDMDLLGFRFADQNDWEVYFDKAFEGNIQADFDPNELDAYLGYNGKTYDPRGKYLESIIGTSLSGAEKREELEGAPEINLESPKYIGTIADEAQGFLRGTFKFLVSDKRLAMSGTVNGEKFVDVNGAFDFEAEGDYWRLRLGTRDDRIRIKANYARFDGFLFLDPTKVEVGFGAGAVFDEGLDLKAVKIDAYASFYADGEFTAQLDPFEFQRASVGVAAKFKLDCKLCEPTGIGNALGVGSCMTRTLVGIDFSGRVTGDFGASKLSGSMSGSAEVFDINLGTFDVNGEVSF